MNKRDFKKKHKDYLSHCYFNSYVKWCNLYKKQKRHIREQKQGKYKNHIYFIGITKSYIKWWELQLFN